MTCRDLTPVCEITALPGIPTGLQQLVEPDGTLRYMGNGVVDYRLCGKLIRWTVRWEVGPDVGGDTHLAIARGTRSTVIVQHDKKFSDGPEVFVKPFGSTGSLTSAIRDACKHWLPNAKLPITPFGDRIHIGILEGHRSGHESHFAAVLREFVDYSRKPKAVPAWERPNLLAAAIVEA